MGVHRKVFFSSLLSHKPASGDTAAVLIFQLNSDFRAFATCHHTSADGQDEIPDITRHIAVVAGDVLQHPRWSTLLNTVARQRETLHFPKEISSALFQAFHWRYQPLNALSDSACQAGKLVLVFRAVLLLRPAGQRKEHLPWQINMGYGDQ